MTLREEIVAVTGNRRKFLLLRIVDMSTKAAIELCGITRGTYNTWLQKPEFVELYRRRDEFSGEHKQEAIQLLRRDNKLAAVLLEGKLIMRMKEEVEAGEYVLIKTNLAREVYTKLITDLDIQPKTPNLTFADRIANLQINVNRPELKEGEYIDGEFTETTGSQTEKHQTGNDVTESQPTTDETEKEIKKE